MGGTYALVLAVSERLPVRVGALGEQTFPAGGYAYVGSAFGTGGFGRVDRHRRLARGDHDARHWHVDYLLGADGVEIRSVLAAAGEDVECALARELGAGPVAGFGASDCACGSHLAHSGTHGAMRRRVEAGFAAVRG